MFIYFLMFSGRA